MIKIQNLVIILKISKMHVMIIHKLIVNQFMINITLMID